MVDCQNYMIYVMLTIAGILTPPIPQPHRAANLDNHKFLRLAATDPFKYKSVEAWSIMGTPPAHIFEVWALKLAHSDPSSFHLVVRNHFILEPQAHKT